jgi:hypothetical protein
VEVLVGPDKTKFLVHKDKLLQRSTFFKAACSERWQQSGSKAVELPEDIPDIFEIYIHCVYRDEVDLGDLSQRIGEESAEVNDDYVAFDRLIRTWCLADKLGDLVSANALMDYFVDYSDRIHLVPAPKLCGLAYDMSMEGSCIRQLTVDLHLYDSTGSFEDPTLYGKHFATIAFDVAAEDAKAEALNKEKTIAEVYNTHFTSTYRCRYRQHEKDHLRCGRDCEK